MRAVAGATTKRLKDMRPLDVGQSHSVQFDVHDGHLFVT